ncbi:MAG: hypothetical protein ACE361_20215 [Aureliella sp.]
MVFKIVIHLILATSTSLSANEIDWRDLELRSDDRKAVTREDVGERAEACLGRRVTIRGFINPSSVFSTKKTESFIVWAEVQDAQVPPGSDSLPLHRIAIVEMVDGKTIDLNLNHPVKITGKIVVHIARYQDGRIQTFYKILADRVEIAKPRKGWHSAVNEGC